LQTLEDYNICSQLGYHISDNASSNDNLLRHLAIRLREKHGIKYDAITRRIRCSGHIINLSLQAFLFASNQEAVKAVNKLAEIEEEVDVAALIESAMQQGQRKKGKATEKAGSDKAAGWRLIGPLGAYIYTSPTLTSIFCWVSIVSANHTKANCIILLSTFDLLSFIAVNGLLWQGNSLELIMQPAGTAGTLCLWLLWRKRTN